MEWEYVTKAIVFTVCLFFMPGFIISLAARQKGFNAIGPAPAFSVAIIASSAIIAPFLGIRWSVWVPIVFTMITAIVVSGILFFVHRNAIKKQGNLRLKQVVFDERRSFSLVQKIIDAEDIWYLCSMGVAGWLIQGIFIRVIKHPDWASQGFDGIFHLNAVQFIVQSGNASSLFVGAVARSDGHAAYYPAAWHDFTSLVVMHTGVNVFVAANIVSLVISALVWPASVLYLVRCFGKFNGAGILIAGIASAGLLAFPWLLLDWGVLYPNMLGLAVLPTAVGLMTQVMDLNLVKRFDFITAFGLGSIAFVGTALAHPNGAMSAVIIMVPCLLVKVVLVINSYWHKKNISARRLTFYLLGTAFSLCFIWFLWGIIRPAAGAGTWEPGLTQGQGIGEAITNAPMGYPMPVLLTLLMLVGIYVLMRKWNRGMWLGLAWIYYVYFFSSARWLTWADGREWVTGVWYNDPYRIAAIMPIFTVVFCCLAVDYAVGKIIGSKLLMGLTNRNKLGRITVPVLTVVLAFGPAYFVGVNSQNSKSMLKIENKLNNNYDINKNSYLLSLNEMSMFEKIDDLVPADDMIVVIPNTGAPLAYAYSGRKVTETHMFYTRDSYTKTIDSKLNQAKTDPAVCKAVENLKAYYVLDFGSKHAFNNMNGSNYTGLSNLSQSGVVQEVYRTGPETVLYKITACN